MAGLPPSYHDPFGTVDFDTYDYVIGGKLVQATTSMSDDFANICKTEPGAREKVRMDLALQLAKFMIENNLVEITQYKDPIMFQTRVVCRAYLAPDSTVKILRLSQRV